VDAVNATSRNGLAAALESALRATGFTPGLTSNAPHHLRTSMIYYPDPGSAPAANTLAAMLGGLPTALNATVPPGHLRVMLGADFTMPDAMPGALTTPAAPSAPAGPHRTGAEASGAGPSGAGPGGAEASGADSLSGTGIPCVT
jgi:hypothetical protein